MALFLVGIVDLTGLISTRFNLQRAADRTLQLIAVKDLSRDYAYAQTTAAEYADVALANVTYDAWLECDGTRMPSINDICGSGEEIERLVTIQISSQYQLTFPFSQFATAGDSIEMSVSSTLRVQ
jgi:hypothetical protein